MITITFSPDVYGPSALSWLIEAAPQPTDRSYITVTLLCVPVTPGPAPLNMS